MRLFRLFYRVTALIVLIAGLLIIPFLDVLMKDRPDVDHLVLIYLLYLLNSVVSYLLIYKKTLVDAHQMSYITVLYHNGFLVLQDICQIVILLCTKNFILFLMIAVFCTFLGNVCMSRKADKMFPYLKEPCDGHLPKEEKQQIVRNVKAMMMHKIGTVAVSNTDNLLISSFVGVISAGIYSNYYLLIGSIRQILDQVLQGVAASVGNLGETEEKQKVQRVFQEIFFGGYWLYGLAGICLLELLNPFVELAFGRKYLFDFPVVLILCINFFLNGTRKATLIFKESMGLFWYDRYKSIIEAILNLITSILFVLHFGITGVFMGTITSTVLTSLWVEPYVLYKYRFQKSAVPFFLKYALNLIVMGSVWVITDLCCRQIEGMLIFQLIIRLGICAIIPNLLLWLLYKNSEEYKELEKIVKVILEKLKNRRRE